jgi:hypothetical protein
MNGYLYIIYALGKNSAYIKRIDILFFYNSEKFHKLNIE